jgi:hypothetical protein
MTIRQRHLLETIECWDDDLGLAYVPTLTLQELCRELDLSCNGPHLQLVSRLRRAYKLCQ